MADHEIDSLMKAQLERDRHLVRDWARRLGVNYAVPPELSLLLTFQCIDRVEIAQMLASSVLKEFFVMFGCTRYRVEPEHHDEDTRIMSATVCIHADSYTIELIAVRTKEDHQ